MKCEICKTIEKLGLIPERMRSGYAPILTRHGLR